MKEDDIKFAALRLLSIRECPDFIHGTTAEVIETNRRFPITLIYGLTRYIWNFATRHATLTTPEELVDQKYLYRYKMPEDFLYLRGQYLDRSEQAPLLNFEFNGKYLDTNAKQVFIRYTAKVPISEMPLHFTDYVAVRLAYDLCDVLTGNSALKNTLFGEERLAFLEAKNIDARQNPPRVFKSSPFVDVRRA